MLIDMSATHGSLEVWKWFRDYFRQYMPLPSFFEGQIGVFELFVTLTHKKLIISSMPLNVGNPPSYMALL